MWEDVGNFHMQEHRMSLIPDIPVTVKIMNFNVLNWSHKQQCLNNLSNKHLIFEIILNPAIIQLMLM